MKRIFLMISLISMVLLNTCSDNPVVTEDKPGSRDYKWIVDTLNYPGSTIGRMWGNSPSDVWAISSGGDLTKTIFHYDGNKWTTDGEFRLLSPHSIWGFSEDNVWIGGLSGVIWHYDGNSWSENTVLTKDEHTDIVFDNMWGNKSNNLYAFGAYHTEKGAPNYSIIVNYTNKWTILDTEGLIGIVERYYKNKSDGKFYVRTNRIGGGEYPDSNLIYEYQQGKYSKIYGSIWTKGLQADLSIINGEVYFVLGNEIATRVNNQFKTVVTVDNPNFYQRIWGRNSKDIFLLMTNGLVHYNGSDMEYLFFFNKPRTQIFGAALFEKEVFFVVSEPQLNLMYHGMLNE